MGNTGSYKNIVDVLYSDLITVKTYKDFKKILQENKVDRTLVWELYLISQVGLRGSEVKLNRYLEQLVQFNFLGAGEVMDSTILYLR